MGRMQSCTFQIINFIFLFEVSEEFFYSIHFSMMNTNSRLKVNLKKMEKFNLVFFFKKNFYFILI
jgi:hypothetical protein